MQVDDIRNGMIHVTGGENETKNYEERAVPVIPAMQELLERMEMPEAGRVFDFTYFPKKGLAAACARQGCPHLSPHRLRDFFATVCVESGVDFATLAKWLGHKDGGVLAAKTYAHVRNKHSDRMAAMVKM